MTWDWGRDVTRPLPEDVRREVEAALERSRQAREPETPAAEMARRWASMGTDEVQEGETEPWE